MADSVTFSAKVPAGGGWRVDRERELNPGLVRIRQIVSPAAVPTSAALTHAIDYQIDLGDSRIAVLGGPGLQARAIARRVATSVEPYL